MAQHRPDLPVHHRTGLRAVGIVNGRPVWPILGAEDTPPAQVPPVPPPVPSPPPLAPDLGFPAQTPVEQMTVDQQAAYWKHQSRRWEDRAKPFKDVTPDTLAELRAKAEKHDALELELGTEADKKAAEARKTAAAEADARYQPLLVQAKFEAAAAGRIEADKLATILEPLDMSKFLAADGTPDTDKVKAYVDGIAPATGTAPPPRTGPSSSGQGNRAPVGTTKGDPARAWLAKQGIKVD